MYVYNHPEVDRIRGMYEIHDGSFQDHVQSTPGWLYVCVYNIYIYMYGCFYRLGAPFWVSLK